jgi:hypothetical protein
MSKLIDITGQKFGKLTVIKIAKNKNGRVYWECKCDCGNPIQQIIESYPLRHGQTKSCGCIVGENHGKTNTRLYQIWINMKSRCYNKNVPEYKYYGAKGVIICNDWFNSFNVFYGWAINNGYDDNLTIDRIDVSGNYEPNNCKWVTEKAQCNNRTTNIYIEIDGEIKTLKQWCEIKNINYNMVFQRYQRYGLDLKKLFDQQPIDEKFFTYNGYTLNLKQWADIMNINYKTFMARYYRHGFNPDKIFAPVLVKNGDKK